jgi:hypothetical protein
MFPCGKPTVAGYFKYRASGGFYRRQPTDELLFPCRCKADCPDKCLGECGCFACRVAEVDRELEESPRMLRAARRLPQ